MAIKDGQTAAADEVMNALGLLFKNFSQVAINEAYDQGADDSSWNAKLNNDGVPQWKKFKLDTFQTDSALTKLEVDYDSTNDYYYTHDLSSANLIYFDIYATSVTLSTLSDIANNLWCTKIASGIWRLYSWNGTVNENVNRALTKLFEGLGASVSDPNGVTGLTDLRSSEATYRNMKVRVVTASYSKSGSGTGPDVIVDWSFSASGTKYFFGYGGLSTSLGHTRWEMPSGTTIHSASFDDRNTSTIHSAAVNTAQIDGDNTNVGSGYSISVTPTIIMIRPSAETLTITETTDTFPGSFTESADISISTTAPDTTTYPVGISYLTFKSTIGSTLTNAVATWNSTINAANTLTVDMSFDGTNWTTLTDAEISRPTNTGTDIYIRFTIDRTSGDKSTADKITEYATIYNWY